MWLLCCTIWAGSGLSLPGAFLIILIKVLKAPSHASFKYYSSFFSITLIEAEELRTIPEILDVLGFPADYDLTDYIHFDREGMLYLYVLFNKHQSGQLTLLEAMDVYSKTEGYGLLFYFSNEMREPEKSISTVLGIDEKVDSPYFGWPPHHLSEKLKGIFEGVIHNNYVDDPKHPYFETIIGKAIELMYGSMVVIRSQPAQDMRFMKRKAGHSAFGKHHAELEQDAEHDLANWVYVMLEGSSYEYRYEKGSVLKEFGRAKVLMELRKREYLNDEQSALVEVVQAELGL